MSNFRVRNAFIDDVPAIRAIYHSVYGHTPVGTYSEDVLRAQIRKWWGGQFVALDGDRVIGHAASFLTDEETAMSQHTWEEVTGGGLATNHDPKGRYLYAMDIVVSPDYRGQGVGTSLYQHRMMLCWSFGLEGIVMGGRIPNYSAYAFEHPDVADYVHEVVEGRINDPVLSFQLSGGFEVIGILPGYLPGDTDSCGYAVKLFLETPEELDDEEE